MDNNHTEPGFLFHTSDESDLDQEQIRQKLLAFAEPMSEISQENTEEDQNRKFPIFGNISWKSAWNNLQKSTKLPKNITEKKAFLQGIAELKTNVVSVGQSAINNINNIIHEKPIWWHLPSTRANYITLVHTTKLNKLFLRELAKINITPNQKSFDNKTSELTWIGRQIPAAVEQGVAATAKEFQKLKTTLPSSLEKAASTTSKEFYKLSNNIPQAWDKTTKATTAEFQKLSSVLPLALEKVTNSTTQEITKIPETLSNTTMEISKLKHSFPTALEKAANLTTKQLNRMSVTIPEFWDKATESTASKLASLSVREDLAPVSGVLGAAGQLVFSLSTHKYTDIKFNNANLHSDNFVVYGPNGDIIAQYYPPKNLFSPPSIFFSPSFRSNHIGSFARPAGTSGLYPSDLSFPEYQYTVSHSIKNEEPQSSIKQSTTSAWISAEETESDSEIEENMNIASNWPVDDDDILW